MKRTEIIELNGVEYTAELNRESFLAIDKVCNVQKSMEIIQRGMYDYVDEVPDDYDPFANLPTDEDIEKEVKLKEKMLHNIVERTLYVCLYPNHKLSLSEVKELVKPYFDDEEKSQWIGEEVGKLLMGCTEIRQSYLEEQKNLKALANKK